MTDLKLLTKKERYTKKSPLNYCNVSTRNSLLPLLLTDVILKVLVVQNKTSDCITLCFRKL